MDNEYPHIPQGLRLVMSDSRWRREQDSQVYTGWQLHVRYGVPLDTFTIEGVRRVTHNASGFSYLRIR